jgi:uncharacterized protein YbjT (DUF2867 family)
MDLLGDWFARGQPMKTLVTGGTGTVGSRVIDQLLQHGVSVRALIRKQNGAKPPTQVETSVGDSLDPVSVRRALQGVDKLYLLNAVVPDELTQGLIAFDLAKRAKLKQIVYHSVFKAQAFKDVPHFASKLAIENALHEFDLPFTIIRPSYFYQNDAALRDTIVKTGVYPVPLGTAGISGVDVRDIAEAAAIALTGDGHLGKTYNLVGPDILTGDKVASILSEVLGKRVRYGGHDMDTYEQETRKTSPAWSAFDLRMMYQGYLERGFTPEDGDVETVTKLIGHPPRRYEEFAKELAPASIVS